MEALSQSTGYILYRTQLPKDKEEERLRVIDAVDRICFWWMMKSGYSNIKKKLVAISWLSKTNLSQVDILVENMGRVTYGHKLEAPTQSKGLGRD